MDFHWVSPDDVSESLIIHWFSNELNEDLIPPITPYGETQSVSAIQVKLWKLTNPFPVDPGRNIPKSVDPFVSQWLVVGPPDVGCIHP